MEKIYYDLSTDRAYRSPSSDIANDNKPEFVYKTKRDIALQILNSTSVDSATGEFDDEYTGFSGKSITPSVAIDNNYTHYFDGALSTALTSGNAVSEIVVKSLSGTPRIAGTIKLTNSAGDTENVNYNTFTESNGVCTFKTADANFAAADFTPANDYAENDTVRIKELPIIKVESSDIDTASKDTGLLIVTVDSDALIFGDMVEGAQSIDDPIFELQVRDAAGLFMIKSFGVILRGLVDDDGSVGPAPKSDYYTKAEDDALLADKQNLVASATQDNLASFDANGQVEDSGVAKSTIAAKADKVAGATDGNFAGLDANGNLTDSGAKPADYIPAAEKGAADGVAELDSTGKVPSAQLPSYTDDVLEYADFASFPATGETGKIYVALDTNLTYRWSGSAYVEISASLALGETSSTAYRGDRGKTAYDHSQLTSGNPHSVTKSDVGLGNVENIKNNLAATSAPTVTDDADAGYSVGSAWVDTTNDNAYICLDVTPGAAVWTETTQAASSLALDDLTDVTIASAAQGDVLIRSASGWKNLGPGTSGQYLKTNGSDADPEWNSPSGSGDVSGPSSSTDLHIAVFNGTTGKLLKDGGKAISELATSINAATIFKFTY